MPRIQSNYEPAVLSSVPAGGEFMDPAKIVEYFGLSEGMRVADFGSGSGDFVIFMAKKVGEGGEVTAIDLLDSALEIVKAKSKIEGLGNVRTVRSNLAAAAGSGLANESQDFVLIANSLFQNPEKHPMIEEAQRILKPGGSLVVIEWKKGAGGFGPPDSLRTDEEEMKNIVSANDGWQSTSSIDAGVFHYGLMFRKI